jgi:Carboxypeptidase regulatory-like domain
VAGVVVARPTGEPVADLVVSAFNAAGLRIPPVTTRSDASGHFVLGGLPGGGYSLSAAGPAWKGEPVWVSVGVGEAADGARLLVDPATTVTLRVSVAGEPCEAGQVLLSGGPRAFAAIAAGQAVLEGITPGHYEATAVCRGALKRSEPIEVGRTPFEADWALSAGHRVLGSVASAAGRPAPGVSIRVVPKPAAGVPRSSGPSAIVRCTSDAAGAFSCSGLAPGAYEVYAEGQRLPSSEPVPVIVP